MRSQQGHIFLDYCSSFAIIAFTAFCDSCLLAGVCFLILQGAHNLMVSVREALAP